MAKHYMLRRKLAVAVLAALGTIGNAAAVDEVETNDSIATSQRLEMKFDASGIGSASVNGVLGSLFGMPVLDVDFFSFHANAGDKLTIDIDNGMNGAKELDTTLYLFGPDGRQVALPWGFNDDGLTFDEGSPGPYGGQDARIEGFTVSVGGIYTVAVTDVGVSVNPDGTYSSSQLGINSGYTLVVSGVTGAPSPAPVPEPTPGPTPAPTVEADIEIKTGTLVLGSRHDLVVALLGSKDFDPRDVDVSSLRFSLGGVDRSVKRCSKHLWRVNRDRQRDLVCHFNTEVTGVTPGSVKATLTGKMQGGQKAFKGEGTVRVMEKRSHRRDDDRRRGRDRDDD